MKMVTVLIACIILSLASCSSAKDKQIRSLNAQLRYRDMGEMVSRRHRTDLDIYISLLESRVNKIPDSILEKYWSVADYADAVWAMDTLGPRCDCDSLYKEIVNLRTGTEIERLTQERDEWQEMALHYYGRADEFLVSIDSITEIYFPDSTLKPEDEWDRGVRKGWITKQPGRDWYGNTLKQEVAK